MEQEPDRESLDIHALVELFGHQRVVGRVTETAFGSTTFFQVDILAADGSTFASRLVNASAVYGMTPVTREWCLAYAASTVPPQLVPYLPPPSPPVEPPVEPSFPREHTLGDLDEFDEDDEPPI